MSDGNKLHIDEDWKSQVDREKDQLRQSKETTPNATSSPAPDPVPASANTPAPAESPEHQLPPASLTILVSSLATQAMASMGQLPTDDGNPIPVDLQFARHFIDLIGVIEDKTKNNLTSEEAAFVNRTLLHLRMLFVESSRR